MNSGIPTQPVCFADVSLSLAMTYWKERSSEGKVAGQEQFLAVVEVVVNSLRRYLKLSRLRLAVSSLLAFACCLGQQFCARGPGCRGPCWIMAHFFQAALGERARESRSSLSGRSPSSPRPPVTPMRDLYIYIFTHTHRSSRLGQGLQVVPPRPCKSCKTL